ncbi:hypothetical protein [Mycobacteroides abscessus]|uniref:hypothetical protein n=1 Tax=Mycobacteroides abscessus TaxID=36809 RepID=UPI001042591A|nr:hypothetical protein [Mycobacteroides abscessus]
MSSWDFGSAVMVFDRAGRQAMLVFLPEDGANSAAPNTALGHVALEYNNSGSKQFIDLSGLTTFGEAVHAIGELSKDCRGSNIPSHYNGMAADADVIVEKLRSAGIP